MIYLTFLSAFLLSGIAAYYSVIGLAAIFTGAFWPVVLMGSALEFAKLVTTSWLYRNWSTTNFLLRSYLSVAVIVLMLITSMGIFGFLSKSHIDSTLDSGANTVEIKTIEASEKIAKERLEYLLARAKDPSTASNKLDKQIQDTQKELAEISKSKLPLLKQENKLTADVGPIKYVADIFYGNNEGALDKAVRLVIFLIMLVFDPLAVLLLIAGNISLKQSSDEGKIIIKGDQIVGVVPVEEDEGVKEFFDKARDIAKKLDEDRIAIDKRNITEIKDEPVEDDFQPAEIIQETPPVKKLQPKYDYNEVYAFREKEDK